MASIAALEIEIKAQGKEFTATLNALQNQIKGFESTTVSRLAKVELSFGSLAGTVNKVGAAMSSFAALASGGFALGGLTALIKGAAETGDTIGDMSTKLGLSTDAFQEFAYAAKLSGVSAEEFEGSVTKLNKSIAEAATDRTSKAAQAFQQLGVSIKDANGNLRPSETILSGVLTKLNEVPNQAQKTQLALELMGKGAANMLILAAENVEKLRQNARDLGIVIPADTIQRAGELNDKLDTLSLTLKARLVPALVALAPWLVNIVQNFANLTSWVGLVNEKIKEVQFASLQAELHRLNSEIANFKPGDQNPFGFDVWPFNLLSDPATLADLKAKRAAALAAMEELAQPVSPGAPPSPAAQAPLAGPNKEQQNALKQIQDTIDALTAKNAALRESIALNLSVVQSEARQAGAEAAQKTGRADVGAQVATLTEAYKNLTAAQAAQFTAQQALAESSLALPEVLAAINEELAKQTPWQEIADKITGIEARAKVLQKFAGTGASPEAALAATRQTALQEQTKAQAITAGQFLAQTRQGLLDNIDAERTRIAVLREDSAAGKSFIAIQRDIANALELVKLEHAATAAGLDKTALAELAVLTRERQAQQATADMLQQRAELASTIASDISRAFSDMAKNITNTFEIMRSSVLRIIDDVANAILQQQVTKPLADWINRMLDQILGKVAAPDMQVQAQTVYVNGREQSTENTAMAAAAGAGGISDLLTSFFPGGAMPVGTGAGKGVFDYAGGGIFDASEVEWGAGMGAQGAAASGGGLFGGIRSLFSGITSKISGVVSSLFSGAGGGLMSMFSGLFSGAGGGLTSLLSFLPALLHTGGIAGMATSVRSVHPSVFVGAPRYHTGLMPGEVAAILKRDEGVFTPGQMAALGQRQGGVTIVQNISTPDVGGFQRAHHQLAVEQRTQQEVALRRFN
jgi:hypothetical protein